MRPTSSKTTAAYVCSLTLILTACAGEREVDEPSSTPAVTQAASMIVPGVVLAKLTPQNGTVRTPSIVQHGAASPLAAIASLGGTHMGAAFRLNLAINGPAKRALGLDRWHRFEFDTSTDVYAMLERVKALPGVDDAAPDVLGHGGAVPPNDTYYSSNQWHLENTVANPGAAGADIDAERGWAITTGSPELTLAVLDTGIDTDHPEFAGRLVAGYDHVNEDADPEADHPHGTSCAGIAAANADNAFGVAGVDWSVKIMPVKVLNANNSGSTTDLIEGLIFATDNGADVISMSLINYSCTYNPLGDALQYARDGGAVVISSAGNGGIGNADTSGPGCWPQTLSVGATTNQDARASFSATGEALDLTAPGSGVPTARHNSSSDAYTSFSGTSAACPVVAGVATLMLSIDPSLDHETISAILQLSADDQVGPDSEDFQGPDAQFGWGRLNMADALEALPLKPLTLGRGPKLLQATEPAVFYVVVFGATAPSAIDVVLEGAGSARHPLAPASTGPAIWTDGDTGNGELYTAAVTMPGPGTYSYSFEAVIAGNPQRDPQTGVYSGLEVLDVVADDVALSEQATASTTIIGNLASTYAIGGGSYILEEVTSNGGKPQNRYSTLEHTFSFDVQGGANVALHLAARRIDFAPDTDAFTVQWSSDGSSFQTLGTIENTTLPAGETIYPLPSGTTGAVWIRFIDTDSGRGNLDNDRLDIDAMFIRSSGSGSTCTAPPVADFEFDVTSGQAPLSVAFSDTSSGDPATEWAWDFGDGNLSSASDPKHTYEAPGTYSVTLTVSNACGSDTLTQNDLITVTSPGTDTAMWVESLIVDRISANGPNYRGRARVTVIDANGLVVANATVEGSFSGPTSGTTSATTNASGVATLQSQKTKNGLNGSWCFTVDSISAGGFVYDASSNEISSACE